MKLLLIGNNHIYQNNLPETVRSLLEMTGQKSHVTLLFAPGKTLSQHAADAAVRFNITFGRYDAVVAQERAFGFSPDAFRTAAASLFSLCRAAGTVFYPFMPFVGRENREAQLSMADTFLSFCRAEKLSFIPAGEVFTRLLTDLPAETLYAPDGRHASPFGSYAAALSVFYTLTSRRRALIPETFKDPGLAAGFDPARCRRAHQEACHTVRLYNG